MNVLSKIERLKEQASFGNGINDADIHWLAQITQTSSPALSFLALQALAWVRPDSDGVIQGIVASYLHRHDDPDGVGQAIRVLVNWKAAAGSLDTILEIAHGQPWDLDEEARFRSIALLGDLYMEVQDNRILRYLIGVYKDTHELLSVRDAAYWSLQCIAGIPTRKRRAFRDEGDWVNSLNDQNIRLLLH